LKKSKFLADEVKYLGFILSNKGICANLEKIEAIQKLTILKSCKELQSFIGLCSFIRGTVNCESEYMAPLTDLLSTKKQFKWTEAHTYVFKQVQEAVMHSTMLRFPDYSLPFEVFCDMSKFQVSAIIAQKTQK
jgi:RNase H-like domain found in reverse transcriptase